MKLGSATFLSAIGATVYGLALVGMDVLIAKRYGLGDQAAVFQAAWQVLATLIAILSGGAILGPLIPLASRFLNEASRPEASAFLARTAAFILTMHMGVALLLFLFAPQLAALTASGFSNELQQETSRAIRWLLPLLLVHGLASIAMAVLLAAHRVAVANLAPVLMPLAGMTTSFFWDTQGALWMAWGYLAGTVLQLLSLTLHLKRERLVFLPPIWSGEEIPGGFRRTFLATALAHAALSSVLLINTAIAGSLSERDLAAFGYGGKLVLLALAFLTTLVTNVGLPYMLELAKRDGGATLWKQLRKLLALISGAGLLMALIWYPLTGWLIETLYARGQFTLQDATAVTQVQRIFVLQAPFYLAGVVCWRALNARSESGPLIKASLFALIVDISAAALLVPMLQAEGIAVAHVLSMAAWSAVLIFAMRSRSQHLHGAPLP